jgi:hypothetical protein
MIELIVNAIVAIIIILSIKSAIVGVYVKGFMEDMSSGKVKINANMPNVSVNLLLIFSDVFSKIKIDPSRKNIPIRGIIETEIKKY